VPPSLLAPVWPPTVPARRCTCALGCRCLPVASITSSRLSKRLIIDITGGPMAVTRVTIAQNLSVT
jgi:hypothetical protein